jgi:hypothetical protein
MAKNRRKKSSKCPEPFNTLIDLAAAATLDYIAYKRRQKRGEKKRSKIDPYAAAGIAMGMGKLNSTEDIIKLGGFLGAMGAFDDDDTNDYRTYTPSRTSSGRVYQPSAHKPSNKNRYAWRMNCENGSEYGIYPENYETRDEYNTALKSRKDRNNFAVKSEPIKTDKYHETINIQEDSKFVCKVSILNNGENKLFITNDTSLKVGDRVLIPLDNDSEGEGIVVTVRMDFNEEDENIPHIIRKCN